MIDLEENITYAKSIIISTERLGNVMQFFKYCEDKGVDG